MGFEKKYKAVKNHIQQEFLSNKATLIRIFLDAVSSPETLSSKVDELTGNLKSGGFFVMQKNNKDNQRMLVIWISKIDMPQLFWKLGKLLLREGTPGLSPRVELTSF